MPERCKSRNPKKPPLKERFLGSDLLNYAQQQVRRGEKAGTRQKRPPALPRGLPATATATATGSISIARVPTPTPTPTQSFGLSSSPSWSFITNTTSAHEELETTVHNNQTASPNTISQTEPEHHDFFEISQHPSTTETTSFGSTSGDNSQDTSTTFTTQSTNLGESSLNNEGLSPLASWTQLWTPAASSTQGDLNRRSYQDLWDWYNPPAMSPAELGQHIQDMTWDIQQSALSPTQNLSPENESFRVKATYVNGHESREALQFNDQSQLNFASQAFLSKLREDSQRPIDVFRTPPGYERWAATPDGVMAPLEFYFWAYLEYESPLIPFPPSWVCLWVYRGTGAADDTKITLGHAYFTRLEEQALM